MKHLKSYENINSQYIDVDDNYYWILKGTNKEMLKIYELFVTQIDPEFRQAANNSTLLHSLKNNKEYLPEAFLYFENRNRGAFSYWIIYDKEDKIRAEKYNKDNNFIFQGELKIVNDKLILDTTEKDANKYNL